MMNYRIKQSRNAKRSGTVMGLSFLARQLHRMALMYYASTLDNGTGTVSMARVSVHTLMVQSIRVTTGMISSMVTVNSHGHPTPHHMARCMSMRVIGRRVRWMVAESLGTVLGSL